MQDGDTLAHALYVTQDMRREQHGHTVFAGQPPNESERSMTSDWIQSSGRLIEQKHARLVYHRLGKSNPLPHAG